MLHHQRQEGDTCMYMAVYALTGNEGWLAYASDAPATCQDDLLFAQRLIAAGGMPFVLFCARHDVGHPTNRRFWAAQRAQFAASQESNASLLISIFSETMFHCVAAEFDLRYPVVRISDSNHDQIQTFTWAGFLRSAYARAYRVELLAPIQ